MASLENEIGTEKLRIGKPQPIDSGNGSITLLDVQDFRVPVVPGTPGKAAGIANARFDFRVGNRNHNSIVLSTTASYGQPNSVKFTMPAVSVLEPFFEYEFTLEDIEPVRTLEGPPAVSSIVAMVKIVRREKTPSVKIHGDRSRLPQPERRFVEYWGQMASAGEQRELHSIALSAKKGEPVLNVANKPIRLIEGFSVIMNPESTGELEISFYKSDLGEFFFRRRGGCVAFRDLLFGPFREVEGSFRSETVGSVQ